MRGIRSLAAALGLCVVASVAAAEDRPRIAAVNYPLQYFAERLVGEAADVVFPVPAGTDPSFWRPTIADISMIQTSDLILLNGAGFATWIDRVSLPRARVVNTSAGLEDQFIVTESITHSHGDGGQHSHEGVATYLWLDPLLAVAQAEAVANALVSRGLVAADEAKARMKGVRAALEAVDAELRGMLEAGPDVAIIATHPRYEYLAHRYDLAIHTLEWDAGALPDAQQMSELAQLAKDTGARILVWEAAPPEEAIAQAEALGLASVIFDPMVHRPSDGTFLENLAVSFRTLGAAVSGTGGG